MPRQASEHAKCPAREISTTSTCVLENHRRSMVCSRGEERAAITNDLASDMIAAIQFLLARAATRRADLRCRPVSSDQGAGGLVSGLRVTAGRSSGEDADDCTKPCAGEADQELRKLGPPDRHNAQDDDQDEREERRDK